MHCLDERFIHGDIKWFAAQPFQASWDIKWFAAQPFQTAERRVRLNRQ